jgi:hypothetical protein
MGTPFPEQKSVLNLMISSIFEKKVGKVLIQDVNMLSNRE